MFDPWTATLDEAMAAQSVWYGNGIGREPIFQWDAARQVEARQNAVVGGDGFAVLACIRTCVTNDLVAPEWLAYAFNAHFDKVLNCRVGSWDAAFGKPYPGKHLRNLQQRRKLRFDVLDRIRDILKTESKTAVDETLFAQVGREFNIGKTLCGEMYYEAKRLTQRAITPAVEALLAPYKQP
jgi:hypothetical protein